MPTEIKIITALQAREVMAKSEAYKQSILEEFSKEIKAQAEKGESSAWLSFDFNDSQVIMDTVRAELVMMGYTIDDESHLKQFQFKVAW